MEMDDGMDQQRSSLSIGRIRDALGSRDVRILLLEDEVERLRAELQQLQQAPEPARGEVSA